MTTRWRGCDHLLHRRHHHDHRRRAARARAILRVLQLRVRTAVRRGGQKPGFDNNRDGSR